MKTISVSAQEVASWFGGVWSNPDSFSDATIWSTQKIEKISPLGFATANSVAFFFNPAYQVELLKSQAGVLVTGTAFVQPLLQHPSPELKKILSKTILISCADPYGAMAAVTKRFSAAHSSHDHQDGAKGIDVHQSAVIDATVKLPARISIGANAVIGANVKLADGVVIYPNVVIAPNCAVGEESVLFPNVTLYEGTVIGKKVRIHAGAVIGADGFGYSQVLENGKPIQHQKIYHLGGVVIDDQVEIGANTTIDRGTLGDTHIHKNVKIDNQVQIGHNCVVGEGSIICGTAGMAGSSSLGRFVVMGAQAGTANQVHIGDYSKMAAYSGAGKDVPANTEVAGLPSRPIAQHYKIMALLNRMLKNRTANKTGEK